MIIQAKDLIEGDIIRTSDGRDARVLLVERLSSGFQLARVIIDHKISSFTQCMTDEVNVVRHQPKASRHK